MTIKGKSHKAKVISAFTLIELLVVIGIIGIIAGIIFSVSTSSQKQAYDTQRKSDSKQYQTALEAYAARNNGLYIAQAVPAAVDMTTLCPTLGLTALNTCTTDPKNVSPYIYKYISDTAGSGYVIWAKMESASNLYWIVCSNGKSATFASEPTSVTCPI